MTHVEDYANAKNTQKALNLQDKPCDYFTSDIIRDLIIKTGFTFLTDIAWRKTF